jgi:hypothetical protein
MRQDFQLFQREHSGNWKSTMIFGRGDVDVPGSMPATFSNIATQLKATTARAKPEDQVLIYILGYGLSRRPNEQRTHDLLIEGGKRLDLDLLEEAVSPMIARQVRVAVIDLSCFSGTTQLIAVDLPGTCVISSSTAHYEAVAISRGNPSNFMDKFSQQHLDPAAGSLSLEEEFLLTRSDRFNLAHISSLDTPGLEWVAYWQRQTDPASIRRPERLQTVGWKCDDCEKTALIEEVEVAFDGVTRIADSALATKLMSYRDRIHIGIRAYYSTYKELENYVQGINHILTQRPESPPRFGERPVEDLMNRYNELVWTLKDNRDSIMDAYNLFYFTYHLGKPEYRKGDLIRKRKDDFCSAFKIIG